MKIDPDKLKELHTLKLSNRQIAKRLNIHHRTVADYLKKFNLESNTANQPIEIIDEFNAKCLKCDQIKSITEFQFGRKGQKYEYKFSYCNHCRKTQAYDNLNNNLDAYLKDRFRRLKERASKLKIKFNLDFKYFKKLYNLHKGKCFYSKELMDCKVNVGYKSNGLSIDKIIPEKGYIKGNIVFCTVKLNMLKSNLSLDEIKYWIPVMYEKITAFQNLKLKYFNTPEGDF